MKLQVEKSAPSHSDSPRKQTEIQEMCLPLVL